VLPHTLRFNAPITGGRLLEAADVLGLKSDANTDVPEAISRACRDFSDSLGVPSRLRDLRIPHDALPQIADDVANDWFFTQNPRPMPHAELMTLLEAAW